MTDRLRWDELEEGDVLILPMFNGPVPIRLEPTCRRCVGPEIWNQVCVCGSPTCSGKAGAINVRVCFARNPGLSRIRRGDREFVSG